MELATMRFSDYEWKYNPLTLKIAHKLSFETRFLPLRGEELVDPAFKLQVVSGKGEIMGDDCISQYKEMEKVFLKGTKGLLTLPGLSPVYVYFTKFEAEATDTPGLIEYSFEFTQADTEQSKKMPNYHIGKGWENLYGIAYDYGVSVEKLVDLNPWIKRPDEQFAGKRVRLC